MSTCASAPQGARLLRQFNGAIQEFTKLRERGIAASPSASDPDHLARRRLYSGPAGPATRPRSRLQRSRHPRAVPRPRPQQTKKYQTNPPTPNQHKQNNLPAIPNRTRNASDGPKAPRPFRQRGNTPHLTTHHSQRSHPNKPTTPTNPQNSAHSTCAYIT